MDDRPPPNGLCPRCGAPFPVEFKGEWWESGRRCAECGVGTAAQGFLVPSDDEVAQSLGTWELTDRSAVTAALVELDIPYRWEPGLVLVVPAAADDHVAGLLDEVAGVADPGAIADPADIDGAADDDGSAQAVMADLFDAVSRLSRAPADPIRADAVVAADARGLRDRLRNYV
jgi:hypothetical protein